MIERSLQESPQRAVGANVIFFDYTTCDTSSTRMMPMPKHVQGDEDEIERQRDDQSDEHIRRREPSNAFMTWLPPPSTIHIIYSFI